MLIFSPSHAAVRSNIHFVSGPEGNSFVFPSPSVSRDEDSRENKTIYFPKEHDVNSFVLFLAFHFNNEKEKRTNQNHDDTWGKTTFILKLLSN